MAISIKVKQINTGSADSGVSVLRTKRFDFNTPDIQKRFSKLSLIYKASSTITVAFYLDTNFISGGSSDATLIFPAQNYLTVATKVFSAVGKTGTIEMRCAASNLEIDSIEIDYALLGSNP